MTPRERIVRRDGISLAVTEAGARGAPPVLLVHGGPDTRAVWSGVMERLAREHHVIAYDVRRGAEDPPRGDAPGDVTCGAAQVAAELAAVIDATSPDRPVHVVGHAWGALAVWELCTTPHADHRVASLTSIAGPCLDRATSWLRGAFATGSPAALAGAAGQLARSWFHRNVVRRLRRSAARGSASSIPVQLIVPRRDCIVSPALVGELARWTRFLVVRHIDAGHGMLRTHPAPIARWIGEHVAAVERGDARPPVSGAGRAGERVVLVFGAGRGVGRAAALAFAEEGAAVIAVDRDPAAAAQTAARCGPRATAAAIDVADPAAMTGLVEEVGARHGAVDVLVNDAGAHAVAIHGCRLFGRQMAEAGWGGHIVNVAAAAASPRASRPAPATSEPAVLMLSECLRAELAEHGVTISAVCPSAALAAPITGRRLRATVAAIGGAIAATPAAPIDAELDTARDAEIAEAIVGAARDPRADAAGLPEARSLSWLGRLAPRARRWIAALEPL